MKLELLLKLVTIASPAIKSLIAELVVALHEKALKTDNPIDDILTELLVDIFCAK